MIRRIELLANIAIIVVACLLGVVLTKKYLTRNSPDLTNVAEAETVGTKLSIPGIEGSSTGKTLVLALSTTCHFCSESAPFYQRLVKNAKNARLIAVMPQELAQAKAYLKQMGISIDQVQQLSLDQVGVQGTPTLILLDNSGVVRKKWVGKLSRDGEQEVISAVSE